ncbi:MAG TPA: BTAD domain-containing putative transcriptional regulator [Candidatus Binatia bacterium]|nr:BTAD domain-containing putative transcriptional regulator [Candidatus Binatia bacterium]
MKPLITMRLFGKFSVHCEDQELLLRSSSRAREILGYLAVNRRGPVLRESLATLLAHGSSAEKSRKAIRQALWQLRANLAECPGAERILRVEGDWVHLLLDDRVWLDVAEFERVASAPLAEVVEIYRGEFLEGWFQGWCLEERERLRQIYLESLDALVAQCEADRDVKAGVAYAALALHTDSARECTHRSLMRLYCLAGDRASALRQYDRCCSALRQELGIGPDDETKGLERAIRAGHLLDGPQTLARRS